MKIIKIKSKKAAVEMTFGQIIALILLVLLFIAMIILFTDVGDQIRGILSNILK